VLASTSVALSVPVWLTKVSVAEVSVRPIAVGVVRTGVSLTAEMAIEVVSVAVE